MWRYYFWTERRIGGGRKTTKGRQYYTVIPKRVVHYKSGAGLTGLYRRHSALVYVKSRVVRREGEWESDWERQRIACVHISPVANKSSPPVGLCGGTRSLGQFISCFRLSYTFLSPWHLASSLSSPHSPSFSLSLSTRIYIYISFWPVSIRLTPSSLSIYNDELSVR